MCQSAFHDCLKTPVITYRKERFVGAPYCEAVQYGEESLENKAAQAIVAGSDRVRGEEMPRSQHLLLKAHPWCPKMPH